MGNPKFFISSASVESDHSELKETPRIFELDLSLTIIGHGDCSAFIKDGKVDYQKFVSALMQGDIEFFDPSKCS